MSGMLRHLHQRVPPPLSRAAGLAVVVGPLGETEPGGGQLVALGIELGVRRATSSKGSRDRQHERPCAHLAGSAGMTGSMSADGRAGSWNTLCAAACMVGERSRLPPVFGFGSNSGKFLELTCNLNR